MPATAVTLQDFSVGARIEAAARAAAGLLLDLVRVDGAVEMRQGLKDRARSTVGRYADLADGCEQFVGAAPPGLNETDVFMTLAPRKSGAASGSG
jgi:hypothetical protein